MFGMEEQQAKGDATFVFDFERDMGNFVKKKQLNEVIAERTAALKKQLREGGDGEIYDKLGILLHGYNALGSIVERASKKGT